MKPDTTNSTPERSLRDAVYHVDSEQDFKAYVLSQRTVLSPAGAKYEQHPVGLGIDLSMVISAFCDSNTSSQGSCSSKTKASSTDTDETTFASTSWLTSSVGCANTGSTSSSGPLAVRKDRPIVANYRPSTHTTRNNDIVLRCARGTTTADCARSPITGSIYSIATATLPESTCPSERLRSANGQAHIWSIFGGALQS